MTNNGTNSSQPGHAADELRLVQRAQRGDRCALEELARCFRPRLVHLLSRRTGCWADAEDVAQDALMRALQRIDRHDGRRRFSVWLYRIALRIAADHHRKARPEPGLDSSRLCDPREDDPAKAATDGELRANLWSIAQGVLSADQYSALWLRYAEGMSIKEVAGVLGRTRISTRVLLHRARQRLAPHLISLVDDQRTHTDCGLPTPVESRK